MFSVWPERDFGDVLGEYRSRLGCVRVGDRANLSHVVNYKTANVAELNSERIGPGFKEFCRYLADLALTGNESGPQCGRKVVPADGVGGSASLLQCGFMAPLRVLSWQ